MIVCVFPSLNDSMIMYIYFKSLVILNYFFLCMILLLKQCTWFMLDSLVAPWLFETPYSCQVVINGEMKFKNLLDTAVSSCLFKVWSVGMNLSVLCLFLSFSLPVGWHPQGLISSHLKRMLFSLYPLWMILPKFQWLEGWNLWIFNSSQ